jgi:acyl-CoA thioesterase I
MKDMVNKFQKIVFLLFLTVVCLAAREKSAKKQILFLGNSITAGLGLSVEQAYPALIANKIDSVGLNFKVINAGLSGETTSAGLRRVDWLLKNPVDILFLALGANDGLRGIPLDLSKQNLKDIIVKVRKKYPRVKIILAGMQIPPNMGPDYTKAFKQMFIDVARSEKVKLLDFLLQGVGGNPDLNQADGIHPNKKGHAIIAENVWQKLKPLLIEK